MAKNKSTYVCTDCGSEYSRWLGQCNDCKAWNTISEFRQAILDQYAQISEVIKLSPLLYQIQFDNNGKKWLAYANLQRTKSAISHMERRFELQSCESIILQVPFQN